jgi:hypothetical protein
MAQNLGCGLPATVEKNLLTVVSTGIVKMVTHYPQPYPQGYPHLYTVIHRPTKTYPHYSTGLLQPPNCLEPYSGACVNIQVHVQKTTAGPVRI